MKLEIFGPGPWSKPVTPAEARCMKMLVKLVEQKPSFADERCSSCALRAGTVPNGSSLVAQLLELCLTSSGNGQFMCHMAPIGERPCAGFLALTTTGSAT